MKGRRLPFAICLAFAAVGLAMIVFGDAPTRVAGASSLLFFGGGSLALAMPLLTRRGEGAVRLTEVGIERGFLFPLSRAKQLLVVIAAFGMAAAGVLIALAGGVIAGLLCAIVFGTFALVGVSRLFGERGIAITPTRVVVTANSRAEVAWEDVAYFGILRQSRSRMLGVKVSDPQRIERRNGPLARFNRTLVPVDIVIAADQLAADPEVVLQALVAYLDVPERRRHIGTPDELARVL
jgi:hypothetical protein